MLYRFLADILAIIHFAFILFACLGGLLSLRWRKVIWVHILAVIIAALAEFAGWICPLTPLENRLRFLGGEAGYSGGFVEHYLLPVIYPAGLTREIQLVLGGIVVAINVAVYWYVVKKRAKTAV